jgi:hypothetical protein
MNTSSPFCFCLALPPYDAGKPVIQPTGKPGVVNFLCNRGDVTGELQPDEFHVNEASKVDDRVEDATVGSSAHLTQQFEAEKG